MTRGSKPPTYNALLFGSGAARRGVYPPALLVGESTPPDMGELIAVGMGFVFWGMMTGASGGGGMCCWGLPWLPWS